MFTRADGKDIDESFTLGETAVSYSFTDEFGFSATCDFFIEVQDNISPTCITQNFNISLDDVGQAQIESFMVDNGSFDNCEIVEFSLSKSLFTCEDIGTQEITMIISDGTNQSSCTAFITVEDNLAPICELNETDIWVDENGEFEVSLNTINLSTQDNCQVMDIELIGEEDIVCNTFSFFEISVIVSDQSGNSSECNSIVNLSWSN